MSHTKHPHSMQQLFCHCFTSINLDIVHYLICYLMCIIFRLHNSLHVIDCLYPVTFFSIVVSFINVNRQKYTIFTQKMVAFLVNITVAKPLKLE